MAKLGEAVTKAPTLLADAAREIVRADGLRIISDPVRGSAWICAQLRQAILEGGYAHGEKLPAERQLAQAYGASRTTIRAALGQLEQERLVSRRVGSGTFVNFRAPSDAEDIAEQTSPVELIEVRLAIEPHMVRLAVLNATARDIDRLQEAMARMADDSIDAETFTELDEQFHLLIAEATRNPLMLWLYRQINRVRTHSQWNEMKDKILTARRIAEYNEQHRALFDAIRARDVESAVAIVTNHLYYARRQLIGADAACRVAAGQIRPLPATPVRPIHFFLAMLVPASWGLGLTVGKIGLGEMPPLLLMSFRFGVTALTLVWFVRIPRGALLKLCGIAVLGCTLQYGLTFTGMKYLDVATTTLIIHLEVPFGVIAAALLLKEKVGWRRAIGIAIAFGGLLVMYGAPSVQANPIPALMVVGGALTWAIGQVLIKQVGNLGGFVTIAWLAVFATPQLFVASLLVEDGQWDAVRNATWISWGAILYMGVIMTAGAYALWYHLLGMYRVNQVMPFLLLIPIASILSAMILLGEVPSHLVLIGGAIIMVGVAAIVVEPGAWRRHAAAGKAGTEKAATH